MKILIVDDNAAVRALIASVLSPLVPHVIECANGMEALSAYDAHRPDVVLMDIAMEQMDGLAATAALTAAHPRARVVIVTNHDNPDFREAATAAGACGYVLKQNLLGLPDILGRLG